jgi:hypothetical protein
MDFWCWIFIYYSQINQLLEGMYFIRYYKYINSSENFSAEMEFHKIDPSWSRTSGRWWRGCRTFCGSCADAATACPCPGANLTKPAQNLRTSFANRKFRALVALLLKKIKLVSLQFFGKI